MNIPQEAPAPLRDIYDPGETSRHYPLMGASSFHPSRVYHRGAMQSYSSLLLECYWFCHPVHRMVLPLVPTPRGGGYCFGQPPWGVEEA